MRALGLDVSTSCVGVCVLEWNGTDFKILELDHIEFKKCKTLWEKADHLRIQLSQLSDKFNVEHVFVEDAALRFSAGLSSARTIATLLRFNGLASYFARETFGHDAEYLTPNNARKLIGIKTQQVKKCGKSHKQQAFDHLAVTDLKNIDWPLKKSGKRVDWAYDATDAYVIAKAGFVSLETQQ